MGSRPYLECLWRSFVIGTVTMVGKNSEITTLLFNTTLPFTNFAVKDSRK